MCETESVYNEKTERKTNEGGITGVWYYLLRYVAIITMLIDHTGRVLYQLDYLNYDQQVTTIMIGRLAFPLFAYLLVESFFFTKNRKKHLLMIGVFALLSELPFDMVIKANMPLELTWDLLPIQNVIFSLFVAFAMLIALNYDKSGYVSKLCKPNIVNKAVCLASNLLIVVIACEIVRLNNSDYNWMGVIFICLLYLARTAEWHDHRWTVLLIAFTYFIVVNAMSTMYTEDEYYIGIVYVMVPVYYLKIQLFAYVSLAAIIVAQHMSDTRRNNECKANAVFEKIAASNVSKQMCRYFYPAHLAVLAAVLVIVLY